MSSNGFSKDPPEGEDPPDGDEAITCDALCSLGNSLVHSPKHSSGQSKQQSKNTDGQDCAIKFCVKTQGQLPLFLTKTYHMIDRCDADIADWSEAGDNFVIKNADKFSNTVLPMYFKHSKCVIDRPHRRNSMNSQTPSFSSFARQLNFYGFRKLRPDTILTQDVDPWTANHVRFYHPLFQRDKPDLLQQIKRMTTKVDREKDDMDSLRQEVSRLRDELMNKSTDFNQKISELSYDCNRRISALSAEYEKLAALVHNSIKNPAPTPSHHFFTTGTPGQIVVLPTLSQAHGQAMPMHIASTGGQAMPMHIASAGDLLHSLSQAATVAQQQENDSKKRAAEQDADNDRDGKNSRSDNN